LALTSHTSFRVFTEGDTLYEAMLSAILGARRQVSLESYIFADDAVGSRFAEALMDRAGSGVQVRVHIDAAGSLFWVSRDMAQAMTEAGVRVRWFHRWSWRNPARYNRRNHRKLLVVDDEIAFLGGFNIHRENSRREYGPARWRDTHVEMLGDLAGLAGRFFDAFWRNNRRWRPPARPGSREHLISNHPRVSRNLLRELFAAECAVAGRYIYLTTPYFLPDKATQRALMDAGERGVDVRLLVPGKSDRRIARWAALTSYEPLLQSGVRIYEYLPRMLHAKTVVVDGRWSTVGTSNFDYRSFFLNYELNLVSREASMCRTLAEQFEKDLEDSVQVVKDVWQRRGIEIRAIEFLGWMARRFL
jgi:cardiolipin synthase